VLIITGRRGIDAPTAEFKRDGMLGRHYSGKLSQAAAERAIDRYIGDFWGTDRA